MEFTSYERNEQIKNVLTEIDEYAEFMKMCICFISKNEAFNDKERTAIKMAYEAVADSLKRNMDFIFIRPLRILGESFEKVSLSNSQSFSPDQEDNQQNNQVNCKGQ